MKSQSSLGANGRRPRQHRLSAAQAFRPRAAFRFRSVDGLVPISSTRSAGDHSQPHFFPQRDRRIPTGSTARKMLALDAQPNAARTSLSSQNGEREGKCRAVVTQNIDGLHQKAGSKGGARAAWLGARATTACAAASRIRSRRSPPAGIRRSRCGGTIKPDVVLYEEGLDSYAGSSTRALNTSPKRIC